MSFPRIATLLLISVLPAFSEIRAWKSADGSRSVQGEFLKRDATHVTIRGATDQQLTIELTKLHADEVQWLDTHHSLKPPAPDPNAFFDNLTFNDTRQSTLAKLKISELVQMTTDEKFIGRTGLNGVFVTRKKIGDLHAFLYFDWTETGKLKELNLQTDLLPLAAYKSQLEPCWKEFIEVLNAFYGEPAKKGPLPPAKSLGDAAFMPTHLWNLEGNRSALLGAARDDKNYQIVVRFADKKTALIEH